MSGTVLWLCMVRIAEIHGVITGSKGVSIIKVIRSETIPFFVFGHVGDISSLSWR
jgi:hypothetical protein